VARLRQARPVCVVVSTARVAVPVDRRERDRVRDAQAWRGWYKTARWRALRLTVLVRDLFTCGMCGTRCSGKGQAVADHRRPHRGDQALFWDADNLWCLCATCHSSVKQREENLMR
jgi:5-methylcytosine-specific restriction enzyme A